MSRLVPADLVIHSEYRGDLDADGDDDLLVVLANADASRRKSDLRTLMIFQRDSQGKLEKSVQNDRAIPCESCGGMMGDPLQGVKSTADGFLLRFEGGSRELWSEEYRFSYSDDAGTWLLREFESAAFDKFTEAPGSSVVGPDEFGRVPIEKFDPTDFKGYATP